MKTSKGDERGLRLSRLKMLRLALIGIAVVLAVAIAAVYGLYLYTPAEEAAPENETTPALTQETTLPEETTETIRETTAPETTAVPEETLSQTTEATEPAETTAPQESEETQPETADTTAPTEAEMTESTEPQETILFVEETVQTVPEEVVTEEPAGETEEQAAPEEAPREKEELRPLIDPSATTASTEAAAETTGEAQTVETTQPGEPDDPADGNTVAKTVFLILWILLGVDVAGIVILSVMISSEEKKLKRRRKPTPVMPTQQTVGQTAKPLKGSVIAVGMVHNIGARPYQEDSLGMIELEDGALAVVADGMGGLSGGDKVSQKIVSTMLSYGQTLRPDQMDGVLERMVSGVNQEVNRMLGPDGIYKSGSTLLSVLVRRNRFHWITVGDSRIYFYRQGRLVQLNQEHNVGQELLMRAARGEITYEEARNAPKKNRVTSFIGMGNLKYVDKSLQSIALAPGDRILLLTDGIFNALPDQTILAVLNHYHSVEEAAAEMERMIVKKGSPRQDNFTAIILGF